MARWMNPVLRRKPFDRIFAPAFSSKYNHAVILPIQQDIPIPANSILPRQLLETLVEESSTRVVMNSCLCRTVEECDDYPLDLGCLFLGEGAEQIHSSMAHSVSREEALAHINRGIALSLSPTIIHSWFDAAILGIDYKKMLGNMFLLPVLLHTAKIGNIRPGYVSGQCETHSGNKSGGHLRLYRLRHMCGNLCISSNRNAFSGSDHYHPL